MMSKSSGRSLVRLCISAFFCCLLIQSVGQAWFAGITLWGRNTGWQTEIAIWNLGMALVLFPISKNEAVSIKVIPGLMVLSCAFGVNHLQAFSRADSLMLGNLLGFSSNFLMVILGAIVLATHKAQTKK